jgi:hypothetical protein
MSRGFALLLAAAVVAGSGPSAGLAAACAGAPPDPSAAPSTPTTVSGSLPVPAGRHVLVNGLLGDAEWDSSGVARLDAETELRFHRDGGSLYLAVVFLGPRHTGVDLYLRSRGATRTLHVSSALGERTRQDDGWSATVWGRNFWWTANPIGSIVEDGRQRWLEPEAFEFQIDRRELGGEAALFVHLKRPEKLLPAGATAGDEAGWLSLRLE